MPILLADIQDILGAIVPVLFVVFWVVSQVIGGINKARKGKSPLPQDRPKSEIPPSTTEDELAKEIERFLGQKQDAVETKKAMPSPTEAVVKADVIKPPVAPTTHDTSQIGGPSREQNWRPKRQLTQSQPTQSQHGERNKEWANQNTPALPPVSHRVDAIDENGQENREAIIDLPADDASEPNELQSLMANPTTLRQAFLLSQIFSRPEDRW